MGANRVRNVVGAGVFLCSFAVMPCIGQTVASGRTPTPMLSLGLVTLNVRSGDLESVLHEIARQAGVKLSFSASRNPTPTRVTMHVQQMPAVDAFARALAGTGLVAEMVSGVVVVSKGDGNGSAPVVQGSITGKVVDAKTRQGLRGATVSLSGAGKGTTTSDVGSFRVSGVVPGSYTVQVRMLGYTKTAKTVTVVEGQAASIEIAMEPSVKALDQVIVTGTVVATARREIPNAMTVITAEDIEQRGITKIDQLFRGDVPGLFAQNQGSAPGALLDEVVMFSRGVTTFEVGSSAGTSRGTNPIKTYVDGVELANAQYLSQIDPKSIERIEILTGPQASTIYGSNALNGVMQIFTKRGTSTTPQLTLNLLSGWVENNFSPARTPQHDYSAQLNGVEGRVSYNAGGSWDYMGPWTPAKQMARIGGFGGSRLEYPTSVGRVTADVTLRRTQTQSLQRGSGGQTVTGYQASGWDVTRATSGLARPTTYTLAGQTLGLSLSYVPTPWWSHELGFDTDVSDTETRSKARGFQNPSDTTLEFSQSHTDRRSMRYATTAQIPVAAFARFTVTAGVDSWQSLASSISVSPQTLTGSLTNVNSISRQPGHNTGGFLQTLIGIQDRLFFTYGLRAEWNPNFGEEAQPNYAPRYGVAYTQEVGPITAKLRGSYGRSTRPPAPAEGD